VLSIRDLAVMYVSDFVSIPSSPGEAMTLSLARPRPVARAGWWGALILVPLALAGFGLLWPAPQVAAPAAVSIAPAPPPLEPPVPTPGALAAAGPITFAADRAELGGSSALTVQRVAHILGTGPGVGVVLTGYAADAPGPAAVAQRLSEQRASVVAAALVTAGVDRARIVAVGRGAADPLASPSASRRVEISLR
jgi:outer membrane protein OmpA-like peptidoglycan-associated protein